MAAPKITTGYTQPGKKLIVKPNIANYKDTKKYQTDLANFYAKSTDPEAVKYRTDELTKKYGSLKNADGKPLFAPTYIKALAEGVETPESLDIAVTKWATSKMKEATNYDWDTFKGGIDSPTAQKLLNSFVKDPSQVDTALTFKSSGVEFTDDQKKANAIKLQDKTAKAEEGIAALENYDPNAGTWDPSKNTQATPFGDVLSGLISGYKNPYAANYVNPLAAVEKPKLTNIQTPFNKNAIPQDLVSLFNSAGTNYAGGTRANPLVRPTLPNNGLVKLTQPSATESAEQLAKPGTPDTTNTTLPVVTDKPPVVTDKPPVVTDKPPVVTDKPPVVTDKPANWGYVKTPEEIAAEKAAADKIVAEQKAIEDARIAAEKATVGKAAADNGIVSLTQGTDVVDQNLYPTNTDNTVSNVYGADPNQMTLTQGTDVVNQNLVPTNTDSTVSNISGVPTKTETELRAEQLDAERQAGLVALANQQAVEKAAAEKQAEANRLAALARNPDGGPSSLAPINPNTYGPQQVTLAPGTVALSNSPSVNAAQQTAANQATVVPYSTSVVPSVSAGNNFTGMSNNIGPQQVTLNPNAVVSPSGINALSAQTVALPSSGPQPINPSNGGPSSAIVGPISAAQNNLGPLNISNLGAVISPQAMNSTAGGVASLVGPQVTVQPQPAVTQQPTSNIVAGVGTNPALRAKVLAAQAANMKK